MKTTILQVIEEFENSRREVEKEFKKVKFPEYRKFRKYKPRKLPRHTGEFVGI
jgi:hypothetical protein